MSGGEPSSIKQYVPCDIVSSFGCMLNYRFEQNLCSEVKNLYQALYRKWRPKTFDDVIGQTHVTETLKNEVKSGRISHAYLFTGSRGTGKTSCAKILSKAINCLNPQNGNPCGECEICKSIEQENILDIVEIDAASNNGVENIRSMREEVVFSPTKSKYRVYIVDEVHMLSTGAFNAFLKILEEPPPHVVFILATTEIHKLPTTIVSRCQRFDFHRLSPDDISERIKYICEKENIKIDNEAVNIISVCADGAMRDALSILDQCANACNRDINEDSVRQILGISGIEYLSEIYGYIKSGNAKECIKSINKMYVQSKSMDRFCKELLEYFRDLMILKITKKTVNSSLKSIDSSELDLNKILHSLDVLQESYKNINAGVDKKIEMEIALVKICENQSQNHIISPDSKIKKVESVEYNKSSPPPFPPISNIVEEKTDENTFLQWNEILENLKNNSSMKSLYISLKNSQAYISGDYVLIDSKNDLAFELLRQSKYRAEIRSIVKDITGKQYKLGPYKKISTEPEKVDPLNELIKTAESGGVNIKIK